jgi:hypothetical protein
LGEKAEGIKKVLAQLNSNLFTDWQFCFGTKLRAWVLSLQVHCQAVVQTISSQCSIILFHNMLEDYYGIHYAPELK